MDVRQTFFVKIFTSGSSEVPWALVTTSSSSGPRETTAYSSAPGPASTRDLFTLKISGVTEDVGVSSDGGPQFQGPLTKIV